MSIAPRLPLQKARMARKMAPPSRTGAGDFQQQPELRVVRLAGRITPWRGLMAPSWTCAI